MTRARAAAGVVLTLAVVLAIWAAATGGATAFFGPPAASDPSAATAGESGSTSGQSRGVIGEPPPEMSLRDLSGNRVALRGFEGKVVVYDFWAVWCGPCRVALPFFQRMQDTYREDGLVVIGLHVDEGRPADAEVQAFLDEYGVTYTNLLSTVEADEGFRVSLVPTTYLAGRSGLVRKRHLGFNPERTPARLEEEIRDLLGLE